MTLQELENHCQKCQKCDLAKTRRNLVFGQGNPNSKIMFIGEGPGRVEDETGLPFVGKAGQLLDKMLLSINLSRKDVYICNIVKCRPPQNRDPRPDEIENCLNYLRMQLILIKPKIVVCLGRIAATTIMDKNFKITKQHGEVFENKGYKFVATYHPAALLRFPEKKKDAYQDLLVIKKLYEEA